MELGLDILDQTAYSESGLLTGETAAVLGNFQKQTILVGLSWGSSSHISHLMANATNLIFCF